MANNKTHGNKNQSGKGPMRVTPPLAVRPAQPADPQKTLDVKNPEVLERIAAFRTEKTPQNLDAVSTSLMKARVLTPAMQRVINGTTVTVPAVFANKTNGKNVRAIWVYTDKEQIPKNHPLIKGIMNIPFENLVKMAAEHGEEIEGLAINPDTNGPFFNQPLLKTLNEGKNVLDTILAIQKKEMPDPQTTILVENGALEATITAYREEKNEENLKALLEKLMPARVLTLVQIQEAEGKKVPTQALMNLPEAGVFIPLFTAKNWLPKENKLACINVPFSEVVNTAKRVMEMDENFRGLMINPGPESIQITPLLLGLMTEHPDQPAAVIEAMREKQQEAQQKAQTRTVQLTEEQYLALEHDLFEKKDLPSIFFREGKQFVDQICKEREDYVDRLFEENYKDKRMYPYLPEDFSVMPLGIKEHVDVIRIDFPEQDQGKGAFRRAYLSWNDTTKKGRYFGAWNSAKEQTSIIEINAEGQIHPCGEYRSEGEELTMVIEAAEE